MSCIYWYETAGLEVMADVALLDPNSICTGRHDRMRGLTAWLAHKEVLFS
jgi:hypothetical protein